MFIDLRIILKLDFMFVGQYTGIFGCFHFLWYRYVLYTYIRQEYISIRAGPLIELFNMEIDIDSSYHIQQCYLLKCLQFISKKQRYKPSHSSADCSEV